MNELACVSAFTPARLEKCLVQVRRDNPEVSGLHAAVDSTFIYPQRPDVDAVA